MAKTTRRYAEKTLKLLFGSCGNQCAEPNCTNEIIATGTPHSDPAVIGQICHIYAAADNGPRGKTGLTAAERNKEDNLILLCGYHHPLVDKQWETYPAETLKSWKKSHEAKFQKGTAEAAKLQTSVQRLAFLQAYSDEQIVAEVERIRTGRYLAGFPTKEAALALAARVDEAEFAGGSSEVRAKALAWCARLLSLGDTTSYAQGLLDKSKVLAICEEARVAEAFIVATNDKDRALAMLAQVGTAAARSAALRVVTNFGSARAAIVWFDQAGLDLDDLDAEGKLVHLMNELGEGEWQRAATTAGRVADPDFSLAPVLYHAVGMALLVQVAPDEFRASLMSQVPFEASTFPLASDDAALAVRRHAGELFEKVSEFALSMGVATASNPASDYVLWLRLRDPRDHAVGMSELRESMRDPAQSLRRLNLALQFGIKLDLAAVERQIERRIALSGKGSADEAFARFSLVFAQGDPRAAAGYIAKHRAQLYEHLQKKAVQTFEIELLARAGLLAQANEHLVQAAAEGLSEREQQSLRRIIVESEGNDAAAERRKQYEQTNSLRDLINLVNVLEERRAWAELLPYATILFARTRSLEDSFRITGALDASAQYGELYRFLSEHQDLVAQSTGLKTVWAWSLYREGRFGDAAAALKELSANRDDANDRALRVNIAIASGDWDDLFDYSNAEWGHRDSRTSAELLAAGQLAQAANAPRARDLIVAATEKSSNDPAILAAAYFHAANAGWEQNATIGQWLNRAAALSGDDGPLKSMSMRELLDHKPEWDKRESSVWKQLNEGAIPLFGAAHMLNRSLIDFTLLQSLANLSEADPRRRGIVFAYSGARAGFIAPQFDSIALDIAAIITLASIGLLDTVVATYSRVIIPNSTLGWLFQERESVRFHQPSRIKDAHLLKRLVAAKALKVLAPEAAREHTLDREVGTELAGLLLTARSKSTSGDGISRYVVRSAPVHRIWSLMEEEADLSAYADIICSCQSVVTKIKAKGLLTSSDEARARSYLKLHERPWPAEPHIPDGAELYLDDLSVTYLRTVGVLEKLHAAGISAYITENADTDANRLIALEALADRQLEVIESTRQSLAVGLSTGRIRAARSREAGAGDPIKSHPTFAVLGIDENVDAYVVDDRFINRHPNITDDRKQTPILTSLDLIDDLANRAAIPQEARYSHLAFLRRAGYQLIPITEGELNFNLDRAPLEGRVLVETAELRAIRESILRARMSKMLQIPGEVPWLQSGMSAVVRCIRGLWQSKPDYREAAAYSFWLLDLLDLRGFAASAIAGNERNFALFAYASQILQVITVPSGLAPEIRDAYHDWIDETILKDIRDAQPEMFAWLVARARELIAHSAETPLTESEA